MKTDRLYPLIALIILPLALYLRLQDMDYISRDGHVASGWLMFIRTHGLTTAYGSEFYNYTPLYVYLLGFFNLFFPSMKAIYAVKCVSFIGEAITVFWTYRIVGLHYTNKKIAFSAALLLLLTPALIANSARAGQCDIWLTAFLLPMIYYLMQGRATAALVCFGLAFAFKPQAIFLFPCLVVYVAKGIIPWEKLWIIPAVYVVTCLPCWLEGRPLMDLLDIYTGKLGGDGGHNYNAANIYIYIDQYDDAIRVGAAAIMIAFTLFIARTITRNSGRTPLPLTHFMLLATLCATLAPFILPKTYERYFFIADVLSFILAFLQPRWVLAAILIQCSSILSSSLRYFPTITAWAHLPQLTLAFWLNTAALAVLLVFSYQIFWTKQKKIATQTL